MRHQIILALISLTFNSINSSAQDPEFSRSSIKTGLAVGGTGGEKEEGLGFMMSVGYQKSFRNGRIRLNPDIMAGSFRPVLITDTRDQYFRLTSLGLNAFADALKTGPFSLFVGTGISFNYSRGLMGTGGYKDESYYGGPQPSEYFHRLYYAGNVSAGFRLNQKNRRVAYNFSPLNYHFGSKNFFIGIVKFDVDIKLNRKGSQ